jgi:hypothetical protein
MRIALQGQSLEEFGEMRVLNFSYYYLLSTANDIQAYFTLITISEL